jgi:hypothetical protein
MIMRVNKCYSETKKNRNWGMLPRNQRGGHLASEDRADNEMSCDYVWDKLYPPPFL